MRRVFSKAIACNDRLELNRLTSLAEQHKVAQGLKVSVIPKARYELLYLIGNSYDVTKMCEHIAALRGGF